MISQTEQDSFAQILRTIVRDYGMNSLHDERRFAALCADYAPQYKREVRLVRHAFEVGVATLLYDAASKDAGEQAIALEVVRQRVCDELMWSDLYAVQFCAMFAEALSWRCALPTASNAANSPSVTYQPQPAPVPQPMPQPSSYSQYSQPTPVYPGVARDVTLGRQTFRSDDVDLDFTGEPIADISPLAQMTRLRTLSLWGSKVSDLRPLAAVASLRELDLSRNGTLTDISPLGALIGLEKLLLGGCEKIKDISALYRLINLTRLSLDEIKFADASPLSGMTGMVDLSLRGARVEDISFCRAMVRLQKLNLHNCDVRSLSPLAALRGLTELDLYNNYVADLTPLRGLSNLRKLDLDRNKFTDLSPLYGLTSLEHLDISHNSVSDEALRQLQYRLPNCKIVCKN